jgi:CHAT domain-containing protein/tetratricopeptide (TPR) repeat protein
MSGFHERIGCIAFGVLLFYGPSVHCAGPTDELLQKIATVNVHLLAGRYSDAETAGKQLIEFCDRSVADDSGVQVIALGLVSSVYDVRGKYAESEPLRQRVLGLADRLNGDDALHTVQPLELVAFTFQSQDRNVEAERLERRVLTIREQAQGSDHADLMQPLNMLAFLSYKQGRYAEAEFFYKRVIAIRAKTGRPPQGQAVVGLLSLALLYKAQGRYAEAEALGNTAAVGAEKSGEASADFVSVLDFQASLLENQKKYAEAERVVGRALALTRKMALKEKAAFEASKMETLARLQRLQGRLDEAEKTVRAAVEHLEKSYDAKHHYLTAPLVEWARICEAQGRLAEARKHADRAIEIRRDEPLIHHLHYRARLAWAQGRQEEALADLRKAMDLAETRRAETTGGEVDRAHLFGGNAAVYEQMVAWQAELGDPAEAVRASERGRTQTLLEQLELRGVDPLAGVPAEQAAVVRKRDVDARLRVAGLQTQLSILTFEKSSVEERTRRKEKLERELDQARGQAMTAYRELRHSSPSYRLGLAKERRPIALADLQHWLAKSEGMLLHYTLGRKGAYVVVVPPLGRPRVEKLVVTKELARELGADEGPFTWEQAAEEVATLLPLLNRPGRTAEALPRLAALWRLLVPEAERVALAGGKVRRLFVVPDGPLALLPFEALVLDEKGPRYLLDAEVPILYAPSATVLVNLSDRPEATVPENREPVLTVGDPAYPAMPSPSTGGVLAALVPAERYRNGAGRLARLVNSAAESNAVSELFRKREVAVAQLLGADATEANVRAGVKGRRVIHLACHGLADQTWGNYFGALALTPGRHATSDPDDDGFLTLAEVHSLDLRSCELAVLSACNTNFGPAQRGEGVWALSRGFLAAGARRVVASNWLVEDEAGAALVREYAAQLAAAGPSPDYASALLAAKRSVRRQDKWQSPFYWASLVHVGPR